MNDAAGHADRNAKARTIVVTGATGGLGLETASVLAAAGDRVILAGRSPSKGAAACERIRREVPSASVVFERLDLGSLSSISDFGSRMDIAHPVVDVLINNAGVMTPPERKTTQDGFELQIGTNHLGHFALTGRLLSSLRRSAAPRVIAVSSSAANSGSIDFEDLQSVDRYRPIRAYAQSKLANLLFIRHLQHVSDERGWNLICAAAHPGYARTDLVRNGPGELHGVLRLLNALLVRFASHDARSGAMSTVLAASEASVEKLAYYGPTKMHQFKGPPGRVPLPKAALDDQAAARLWAVSRDLTRAFATV